MLLSSGIIVVLISYCGYSGYYYQAELSQWWWSGLLWPVVIVLRRYTAKLQCTFTTLL